jgi:hypothetical protein
MVVKVGDGALASKECKTSVLKETLAPVWKESFELELSEEEAEGGGEAKVIVSVFDHDQVGGNDLLGECAIHLSSILKRNSSTPKWHSIYGFSDDAPDGVGKVGQVYLALKIQPPAPPPADTSTTLEVLVGKGKDLRAMDRNGFSDPYVTLELASVSSQETLVCDAGGQLSDSSSWRRSNERRRSRARRSIPTGENSLC